MERFDLKKIEEIVGSASNPRDAFEKLHAVFPELEVEKMQEHMDFIQSQIESVVKGEKTEVPLELTEQELDMVAGALSLPHAQNGNTPTAAQNAVHNSKNFFMEKL